MKAVPTALLMPLYWASSWIAMMLLAALPLMRTLAAP